MLTPPKTWQRHYDSLFDAIVKKAQCQGLNVRAKFTKWNEQPVTIHQFRADNTPDVWGVGLDILSALEDLAIRLGADLPTVEGLDA